jgi:hypothetical protein
LGEQVYRQVEEVVATGKTAKAAFDVVAKEQKMTVANVQQHYYRFKRKAKTGAGTAQSRVKTAPTRARKRVSAASKSATRSASTTAKSLSKSVPGASATVTASSASAKKAVKKAEKRLRTVEAGAKTVVASAGSKSQKQLDELQELVNGGMTVLSGYVKEVRKNPNYKKLEKQFPWLKNVTKALTR